SDSRFDYYSCALTLGTKTFSYVFQVTWGENVCLYNRIGLTEDAAAHPFRLIPGFHVPEWSKGALMYQIYVDRFCNGDPTNDTETNEYIYLKKPVTRVTDWKEPRWKLLRQNVS
ncbi:MAG: alpha-glycosidase, partial [Eubacterium ventriosum]|nr:alpha-glycosidase [Eubacterium ventriosum]